jgi:hypothetical protein
MDSAGRAVTAAAMAGVEDSTIRMMAVQPSWLTSGHLVASWPVSQGTCLKSNITLTILAMFRGKELAAGRFLEGKSYGTGHMGGGKSHYIPDLQGIGAEGTNTKSGALNLSHNMWVQCLPPNSSHQHTLTVSYYIARIAYLLHADYQIQTSH